jgi:hypothetical protein
MASIKLKGDTSGEVTISAPAVAGTTTLELPTTSSTLATQNALGVRNLIINGDMRIAQRETSASGITSGGYYTVDRWQTNTGTGGTWTQSQDSDVPSGQGFGNSLKYSCTTANASLSAGSNLNLCHRFEGQMLQHLKKGTANAESVTVSFWVKSNKTGTYVFELWDRDNDRHIANTYTINSANTWEKKTTTFSGDTSGAFGNDNAKSLEANWWLVAGTNYTSGTSPTTWTGRADANRAVGHAVNLADSTSNYINITGVQLEVGDTATPFEHRPYDMELARCQRYFSTSYGNNPVGTNTWDGTIAGRNYDTSTRGEHSINIHYPVQMRALPTLTAYSKAGTSGKGVQGSTSVDASTVERTCTLKGSSTILRAALLTTDSAAFLQFHYTADAEL